MEPAPPESLPLSARKSLADAEYSHKSLKPGQYFDCLDTSNSWCVAQALQVCNGEVLFRYDGWGEKYNASNAMVKKVIGTDFQCFETASEVTQYLRGELMIYLDFIFSYDFLDPDRELVPVGEFLQSALKLVAAWFHWVSQHFESFMEHKTNPTLYLVDRNVALAGCMDEMLYMLGLFFARSHHSLKFFLKFDVPPCEECAGSPFVSVAPKVDYVKNRRESCSIDEMLQMVEKDAENSFGRLFTFFDMFCKSQGLDGAMMVLSEPGLPLETAGGILKVLSGCRSVMSTEVATQLVEKAQETILGGIIKLDPKDITKATITAALKDIKPLLKIGHSETEVEKIVEEHELLFSLKMIQSPFFDKQLRGLADINEKIEEISPRKISGQYAAYSPYAVQSSPRVGQIDTLCEWLKRYEFLRLIYSENSHPEIIRKGAAVLEFLAKNDVATKEMIETVWDCQINKHEDIVRAVYFSLESVIEFLPHNLIELVFAKIKGTPPAKYDEKLLQFMKDFTLKAFEAVSAAERGLDGLEKMDADGEKVAPEFAPEGDVIIPATGLYCVPMFWEMIQDPVPFSTQMMEQAVQAFLETIVKAPQHPAAVLPYIFLCMENVKKSKSVCQSLRVAKALISQYSLKKNSLLYVPHEAISQVNEKYRLIDMLIGNLVEYRRFSDSKLDHTAGGKMEKEVILGGRYPHYQNLASRLQFLDYVLFNSTDLTLTPDHLSTLWMEYVTLCKSFVSKKSFLRWIRFDNEHDPVSQLKKFLPMDSANFILDSLSHNSSELCRDFGLLFYKCFVRYFSLTNLWREAVENTERLRVTKFEALYGLDNLWELAIHCRQEHTRANFAGFLVGLYLFPAEVLRPVRAVLWNDFVAKVVAGIVGEDGRGADQPVANLINLLLSFLHKLDGKGYDIDSAAQPTLPKFTVTFITKPDNENHSHEILTTCTMGQLRRKLAEELGVPYVDCVMGTVFRKFDIEDDDSTVKSQYIVGHPFVVSKADPPLLPEGHPKAVLAQNHSNIDLLFRLLSREDSVYAAVCWELLMSLPRNARIEADLKNLALSTTETSGWDKLLDSASVHKLLYALQIVAEIVAKPELTAVSSLDKAENEETRAKWIQEFLAKRGGNHLFHCLITFPMHSISHSLSRKCFALLLKTIVTLYKQEKSYGGPIYETRKDEIIQKVLCGIEVFSRPLLTTTRKQTIPRYENSQGEDDLMAGADLADKKTQMDAKVKAEEAEAVADGFRLIKSTFVPGAYNYFEKMVQFEHFRETLKNGLISSDNAGLRKRFAVEVTSICSEYAKFEGFSSCRPEVVVPTLLLEDLINDAVGVEHGAHEFYQSLRAILERVPKSCLNGLPIDKLGAIKRVGDILASYVSHERTAEDVDLGLVGILDLLATLLRKFPECRAEVGSTAGLLREVLRSCLFDFPFSDNRMLGGTHSPPKCKSKTSRMSAFGLLCTLVRDTPANIRTVLEYLTSLHLSGPWRISTAYDWDVAPPTAEKSSTGYVGIKNLGCICYMISLLQQLYMIPSFRNAILGAKSTCPIFSMCTSDSTVKKPQVQTPSSAETPTTTSPGTIPTGERMVKDEMLAQLQYLFASLHESVRQYHNPSGFCQAFKDWEGNPINYAEQMDIDEFFNMLMDKLETSLKETTEANTIKNHFGGTYLNQIISKDCPHRRELEEPFLAINLQIKNKKSLQQCMESFVEGETMDGSNSYHCEKCDKKVAAVKRVCIKSLPDHLLFVLKRFSYNYDTMQKVKLNDYCEFPTVLNMDPFMSDSVGTKVGSVSGSAAAAPKNEYRLVGVVIHRGVADSGHYYSLIKSREDTAGSWFEFNDNIVTPFDPAKIPEEAFGGDDKADDVSKRRRYERLSNAYMVIYEKSMPSPAPLASKVDIAKNVFEAVVQENIHYWHSKILLSEDYFHFVNLLGLTWNSAEIGTQPGMVKLRSFKFSPEERLSMDPATISELSVKIFKYMTAAMLTTFMRSHCKDSMYNFVDILKWYMGKHFSAARWFIGEFSSRTVFAEYMLGQAPSAIRLVTVGLLHKAMEKLFETEKADLGRAPTILGNFIGFVMSILPGCRVYKSYTTYYLQILSRVAMLGPEARTYLRNVEAIRRIVYFVTETDPTEQKLKSTLPVLPPPACSDLALPTFIKITTLRPSNLPLDYGFLLHCLSLLIRSSALIKSSATSPLRLDQCDYFGDQYATHVLTSKMGLEKMLRNCVLRLGKNSVAKMLAHLCWESASLKDSIRKEFMKLLDEGEYNEVELWLRPLVHIVRYKDALTDTFAENVLRDINGILQKYQYAYYFMYHATDYLAKMCRRSEAFLKAFRKMESDFDWLYDYYKENWHPPRPIPGWSVQYYKNPASNNEVLARPGRSLTPSEASEWKSRTSCLMRSLEILKESLADPLPDSAVDSEVDAYDEKFVVNETIDYQWVSENGRDSRWVSAVVKKTTGEHLYVSYVAEGGREAYAWVDSTGDTVAKQGTHVTTIEDGSSSSPSSSTCKEGFTENGDE